MRESLAWQPVAKILFGGNPLLGCVHRPQLPALPDNRILRGDVHQLFEPSIVSVSFSSRISG